MGRGKCAVQCRGPYGTKRHKYEKYTTLNFALNMAKIESFARTGRQIISNGVNNLQNKALFAFCTEAKKLICPAPLPTVQDTEKMFGMLCAAKKTSNLC